MSDPLSCSLACRARHPRPRRGLCGPRHTLGRRRRPNNQEDRATMIPLGQIELHETIIEYITADFVRREL